MAKKKKKQQTQVEINNRAKKARRSLGLARNHPLPRCGHRVMTKARELAEAGDASHLADGHTCDLCSCKSVAGKGTNHYGVGWCYIHERKEPDMHCKNRAEAQTIAIREGYPDKVPDYTDGALFMEKIEADAISAEAQLSIREEINSVRSVGRDILKRINGDDATGFTESGKEGNTQASDATLVTLYTKLLDSLTRMSKVELEIADLDYVHWDDVKIYFGKIASATSKEIDDDVVMNKILKAWSQIQEPASGRRKKKR